VGSLGRSFGSGAPSFGSNAPLDTLPALSDLSEPPAPSLFDDEDLDLDVGDLEMGLEPLLARADPSAAAAADTAVETTAQEGASAGRGTSGPGESHQEEADATANVHAPAPWGRA